ncbi:lipopolysaccharide biosynthesis protein [Sphingomonas lycopersici]|uniref:Oligosaccharide flippase family protein n=1 Tax=Sphingomonas lycopersici TaxID=2951807 RepID=A0AA42CSG9_9SPHN|nr:oligosaccharide flippase family protein [Sphingomonas lycopersici]MCW6537272.1 oligosaccharide flippase family protein [Sphingomonas lycopersici]
MRVNRNIVANYASRLWSGLSTFAFVPLYLRLLGPEAFGLVTFSMTLLGVAFILDMGMSNAFAREMAREPSRVRLATLLRSLEIVYLGSVLLVALLTIPGSRLIANYWLNASTLDPSQIRRCVALMLMSSMLQVMMALYMGGLFGSNRHVAAASFQIGFGFVRSGLVLIPLYFLRNVEFIFVWQLGASLLCLLLLRSAAWRDLRNSDAPAHFSLNALRTVGRFAGGMFGIALISTINTQSDKIVVSKIFSLTDFGAYSIASLIGQVPSMLALPLAITILPRLTAYAARDEHSALLTAYLRYSMMIAIVAFGAAGGIIAGAPQLLSLITAAQPNASLVDATRLLAIGGAFLATQYMPYHLAIACGHTRTNLILGSVSAAVLPFAIWFGAERMGLLGAAWPWLVLNATGSVLLAWRIIPRFLGSHLTEWAFKANILPFAINAAIIIPGSLLIESTVSDLVPRLGLIALLCSAAMAVNILFLHLFFRALPAGSSAISQSVIT